MTHANISGEGLLPGLPYKGGNKFILSAGLSLPLSASNPSPKPKVDSSFSNSACINSTRVGVLDQALEAIGFFKSFELEVRRTERLLVESSSELERGEWVGDGVIVI